jgi:hypothetical protein
MNRTARLLPALIGAAGVCILLKAISRPGLTFELATLLVTFLVVTVIMVSAMQSYGNKL